MNKDDWLKWCRQQIEEFLYARLGNKREARKLARRIALGLGGR